MTFEGQYLTYQEYLDLGGSQIEELPFNLLEYETRKQIDIRTQDRIKSIDSEDIPQEVKLCVYHLIGKIQLYQKDIKRNISSESVGSYSVSYIDDVEQIIKNKNVELDDIITSDLYGVIVNEEHVIYLGVG